MSKLLLLCAAFLSLGVARAEASAKNEVVVMATGGTIAGVSADKSTVTGYTSGVVVRNGEVNDDEYGTVPSLSLNPAKARVLLTLCLMKGMDHAAITGAFETH